MSREGIVLLSHFVHARKHRLLSASLPVRLFESCKHAPMACLPKLSPLYPPFTYINLVSREGFEPSTPGLKVRCSTNWANGPPTRLYIQATYYNSNNTFQYIFIKNQLIIKLANTKFTIVKYLCQQKPAQKPIAIYHEFYQEKFKG